MSGDKQFEDNCIEFYRQIKSRNQKTKIETVKEKQSPKKDNLKDKKQKKTRKEKQSYGNNLGVNLLVLINY